MTYTDAQFLARAQEEYQKDGEVEFDDDAEVSQSRIPGNEGAYVQAWVWVEFPEEKPMDGPCQHGSESCTYPNQMESYNWCDRHRADNGRN